MMRIRQQKGFTIISVLIAIVMLSIGILSLSRVTSVAMSTQSVAAVRSVASGIARGRLEDLRRMDPNLVVSQGATKVDEEGVADPNGKYTITVVVTDERSNLKRIKVLVDYPRGTNPVALETMVFVNTI